MNDGERKNLLDAESRIDQITLEIQSAKKSKEVLFDELDAARRALRNLRYSQETIDYMNSTIIDNCNAVAGPDDYIIVLGDVIFGELEQLKRARDRIVCRNIYLFFGNHDKDIRHSWERGGLRDVFKVCTDVGMININGQKVWASHYAHLTWNGSHHGVWHCYGHSHSTLEKWRENHLSASKMVDVGIDYRSKLGKGYTPWLFNELKIYMDAKSGHVIDHHGSE
jgi:calcineurin-like phosphoesterase family protein